MIRVPRSSFLDRASASLSNLAVELAKTEAAAVTGTHVQHASDAPEDIAEIERLTASMADQETWQDNASSTLSLLIHMDEALGSAFSSLSMAREAAVAGASETLSDEGRASLSTEVDALRDELLSLANTEFGDRYVFGGDAYDAEAFDSTGTYVGSTEVPETQVGRDRWVESGLDGSSVFQGSVDIFAVLDDLSTALAASDTASITASLTDLDTGLDQLSEARTEVGIKQGTAEDASLVAENLGVVLGTRISYLVDADPVETYTRLTELRTAYTSALQVMGSNSGRNLFDFLG